MKLTTLCNAYVAVALALAFSTHATAEIIEIGFLGLDLEFADDGFGTLSILDAGSPDGGGGIPAESDPLTSVTVEVDDVLAGPVLTSGIFADIAIPVSIDLPTSPGVTTAISGPGIFDLIFDDGAESLLINVDEVSITFVDAFTASFVFGAELSSDIATQALPFGLVIGTPIEIAFSAVIDPGSLTDDGTFITGFTASGSGTISGPFVPEPSTLALAGLLASAAGAVRMRSRLG